MDQLTSVFLVGMGMCIPPMMMLLGPRDAYSLGSESEAVNKKEETSTADDDDDTTARIADADEEALPTAPSLEDEGPTDPVVADSKRRGCLCVKSTKHIPYVMICSDIIIGLGSGMTIKFFPLFFKNEVLLSPSEVNGKQTTGCHNNFKHSAAAC